MFDWLRRMMRGRIIDDVPPELVQCEFGCRVAQCANGKWLTCENRIQAMNQELAALPSESRVAPESQRAAVADKLA
ncbi:hypothetical protein [Methylocapsa acidiphila]|uniref:hypothetical protein n=1 Tax=Methylocapsa acidiphila TaxID=133552 RepID=UPI00042261C6|nr:hypothetical protein [Methylocapsa acidiphila]